MNTKPRQLDSKAEECRGVAIIEAALTIPLLLLFIGGSYDLGTLLVRHISAGRFAYEAVRFAAQVPNLRPTVNEQGPYQLDCLDPTNQADGATNSELQLLMNQVCTRINRLMDQTDFFKYDLEYSGIKLQAFPFVPCSNANAMMENLPPMVSKVTVEVALNWQPMFLTFLNIQKVKGSTTAPYLMNSGSNPYANQNCGPIGSPGGGAGPGSPSGGTVGDPVVIAGPDNFADVYDVYDDEPLAKENAAPSTKNSPGFD